MSNSVTVDLKANNEKLQKTLKESEGLASAFGKSVQAAFYTIELAQKAFTAGSAIVGWAAGFVSAAAESQEAEEKLAAVLESTGHAAGFTREQLVGLSAQLQDVTKYEAEVTQEAMGVLATFKNIRGDVFIEATKAAQDMSTVLGTDLKGSAMQLGKALNDPVAGMAALKRSGVSFTESQEEMVNSLLKAGDVIGAQKIILSELSAEFGGAAEKVGSTFSGKMEIFKNRWGDIAEDIGFALMPIVEKLFPIAEGFADIMENVVQPVLETFVDFVINWGQTIASVMQPTFEWLGELALNTFTAIETVLYNFGDSWNLVLNGAALALVKFGNDSVHFFTDTIPTAVKWFVENAGNLLQDYANFQMTVTMNLLTNIKDFIVATWNVLQGGEFDWKMTGLLDGFESTLKELPEFQDRLQTEAEKILQSEIDASAERIGADFDSRLKKNREVYEGLFKDAKKELLDMANNADLNFDKDAFKTKDDKAAKDKKAKDPKDEKDKDSKAGEFVGLEELNKRIAAAAASHDVKAEQRAAKEAMQALIAKNQVLIDALGANAKAVIDAVKGANPGALIADGVAAAGGLVNAAQERVKQFFQNAANERMDREDDAIVNKWKERGFFGGVQDQQAAIDEEMQLKNEADAFLNDMQKEDSRERRELLETFKQLVAVNVKSNEELEMVNDQLPKVGAFR